MRHLRPPADTAMRDLAPDITRQRLLIEGHFAAAIDRPAVERYLLGLAEHLDLTTYGTPVIHSPAGAGKPENQGFDAFVPLMRTIGPFRLLPLSR